MRERLSLAALDRLAADVSSPGYDPRARGIGIVHIGVGAFHRAHQAVYTDAALAQEEGDWRIAGVSLRSTEIADTLDAQDGLFTVVERSAAGNHARVVGSIARVFAAARGPGSVLAAMADPKIRIVTLTVTEKAYGIDRASGDIDAGHPEVAADLRNPRAPTGVLGFLVEALRLRREAGIAPFTVLCCDNLPENGLLVRLGVVSFARRVDPELARHIEAQVSFPSSMVDRITPAVTDETRTRAEDLTGFADAAAVETEPFSQWFIEDRFPLGRPAWQAGSARFVDDVAPYERMKLRMLNGAHSMLAYAGFLAGHEYVRDAMADGALALLVRRHIAAAARTLGPLPDIDLDEYSADLVERFENPAIAHRTYQIAMDGTEKLPQRIALPALESIRAGTDARPFAFAIAAWARYCLGKTETGDHYELRDPRQDQILSVVEEAAGDPERLVNGLLSLPLVFPQPLVQSEEFAETASNLLAAMISAGVGATISAEAARQ